MIIDYIRNIFEWMCSSHAANIGHLMKGFGLCGIAIMGYVWLEEFKKRRKG